MKVNIYDKDLNQYLPNLEDPVSFQERKFEIGFFLGQTEVFLHGDVVKMVGRPFICDVVKKWQQEGMLAAVSHFRNYTNLLLPSESTAYGRSHPTRTEGLVGEIMQEYKRLQKN